MRFLQVDVFAGAPYVGNPLAVFPESGDLDRRQMQAIAREMNLSETSFVTSSRTDEYDVRIFTPNEELPFAGHPTIGTAWVLYHLGVLRGNEIIQRSAAGATAVTREDDTLWFSRSGDSGTDLEEREPTAARQIASALGIEERDVGMEARELGRSGRLRPALASAGLEQLVIPVRDAKVLGSISLHPEELGRLGALGAYCFTASQAGRLRARGFFPGLGINEDPATGSAAAALGLYLAARLGDVDLEVTQGVEIGRESKMLVRTSEGQVEVGGRCALVLEGALSALP